MKTYQWLTLFAAALITMGELLVFTGEGTVTLPQQPAVSTAQGMTPHRHSPGE